MAKEQVREFPPQHQERQPGIEEEMEPGPEVISTDYWGSGKLEGKTALVTGGDSGIGRAVAIHYTREGADVTVAYLDEHEESFGSNTPMGRAGHPSEVAPAFGFLASRDASYITGQTLHPNGGQMVGA